MSDVVWVRTVHEPARLSVGTEYTLVTLHVEGYAATWIIEMRGAITGDVRCRNEQVAREFYVRNAGAKT